MNMFKGRLKGLMIPSCIAHFGRLIVSRFFFQQKPAELVQLVILRSVLRVPKTIGETIIDLNGRSYISFYCDSQDDLSSIALSLY